MVSRYVAQVHSIFWACCWGAGLVIMWDDWHLPLPFPSHSPCPFLVHLLLLPLHHQLDGANA